MGTTLRELHRHGRRHEPRQDLKFWTPGGSSTPLFTAEHLDVPLDFDSAVKAGSMLGTSAMMIFDEDDSVVRAVLKWTQFYEHESCGKCTPCREGNYWTAADPRTDPARRGHRRGPGHPARPVRQHPRPVVLRARRWRDQPDDVLDQVLPRRVPGASSTALRLRRAVPACLAGAH